VALSLRVDLYDGEPSASGPGNIQPGIPTGIPGKQGTPYRHYAARVAKVSGAADQLETNRSAGDHLEAVFMSGGVERRLPGLERSTECHYEPLVLSRWQILTGDTMLTRCRIE
jgi:hypothetical protein